MRSPTVERRPRSEGRSFGTARVSVVVIAGRPRGGTGHRRVGLGDRRDLLGAVVDDLAVEHLDPPVHAVPRCLGRG